MTHNEFLQRVERYIERKKMTATAFGKAAVGDPNFVFQLRRGRSPSLKVVERIVAFMRGREAA